MEEVKERPARQKVCYTMPAPLSKRLKKYATARGMNQSIVVQLALEEFLRKEEASVRE